MNCPELVDIERTRATVGPSRTEETQLRVGPAGSCGATGSLVQARLDQVSGFCERPTVQVRHPEHPYRWSSLVWSVTEHTVNRF